MPLSLEELKQKVDQYHLAREQRLESKRETDRLEAIEHALEAEIIAEMLESKASAVGGQLKVAALKTDNKPIVQDWPKLYAYIAREQAFDLLQKRLTETAVKARWEDKIVVPGITTFPVHKLTLSNPK